MSEPDQPVQPVQLEDSLQHEGACPRCKGSGKSYTQVKDDCRIEDRCELCGGSGLFTDALATGLRGVEHTAERIARYKQDGYKGRYKLWG